MTFAPAFLEAAARRPAHPAVVSDGGTLTYEALVRLIREAGRVPIERDTLYNVVREHAPSAVPEASLKVKDRKASRHLAVVS